MQFTVRNVAKVELDSTSATVARNVARKVAQCVCDLNITPAMKPPLSVTRTP